MYESDRISSYGPTQYRIHRPVLLCSCYVILFSEKKAVILEQIKVRVAIAWKKPIVYEYEANIKMNNSEQANILEVIFHYEMRLEWYSDERYLVERKLAEFVIIQ